MTNTTLRPMTDLIHRRFPKTSIIKPIDLHDSFEDIYTDDNNHQNSSSNIDPSRQTITTSYQSHNTVIYRSNNNINNNQISSENICDKSISSAYEFSSHTTYKNSIGSTDIIRSHSPEPFSNQKTPSFKPIGLRPSCSLNGISRIQLDPKLTDDSGIYATPATSTPISSPILSPSIQYEIVPIVGQQKRVLMANRYNFDQKKIDEYLNQKLKKNPKLTNVRQASGQSSAGNSPTKPFKNIFSFFKKSSKTSSPPDVLISQPIVRHHSSADQITKNF
ncbi:unnamed protein product [Rotaria sp. Silwood1]|nr:unnamed protein product [Rotaria sp. Silwood1]CAF1579988.1 unnamed protein product [Rotaria sp. Silwood1]